MRSYVLKVPGNLKLATLSTALPFMCGGVSTSFFFSKKSVVCSFNFFLYLYCKVAAFSPHSALALPPIGQTHWAHRLHCCKVTCTFDDSVGLLWLCRNPVYTWSKGRGSASSLVGLLCYSSDFGLFVKKALTHRQEIFCISYL